MCSQFFVLFEFANFICISLLLLLFLFTCYLHIHIYSETDAVHTITSLYEDENFCFIVNTLHKMSICRTFSDSFARKLNSVCSWGRRRRIVGEVRRRGLKLFPDITLLSYAWCRSRSSLNSSVIVNRKAIQKTHLLVIIWS